MSKTIVDAQTDSNGNITSVKFSGNKNFTPVDIAINMAERGEIKNAHVVHRKTGKKYLRSNPDTKTNNNLDELAKS